MANVISRAFSQPLVWTDELAIYFMAAAAFVGASVGLAHNQHIAITLITGFLSDRRAILLAIVVKLILIAFFVAFAAMLWRWFDPIGVLAAESLDEFSATTFNFVYQEPTVTLGMSKIWFWLVLPFFCLTGLTHLTASISTDIQMLREPAQ
jgi:TRAP-type C4-dicarboxylate transport system permease small subunit